MSKPNRIRITLTDSKESADVIRAADPLDNSEFLVEPQDPKYGELVESTVVESGTKTMYQVSIIRQRGEEFLDIRRLYIPATGGNVLRHGKGIRIPMHAAVDVVLAAETLVGRHWTPTELETETAEED